MAYMNQRNEAHECLEVAVSVAREAAELVRRRRAELIDDNLLTSTAHTKTSAVDPVTQVDEESEKFITSRLSQLRPDDGVMGEEGAAVETSSGIRWIVDPIDGTVNFLYGIPQYAVSIAAARGEELLAGAVINVATGRIYRASAGGGAEVSHDGGEWNPVNASRETQLATTLVATGFSYTSGWRAQQAAILQRIIDQVRDIRRMGSAALDLCAVAEGRIDAYYEHATHPWDYAAGALIAAEAGARVSHPGLNASGKDAGVTVAAAPGVSDEFKEMLLEAGALEPLKPVE